MRLAYSCMATGLMLGASAFAADDARDFNALLKGEYMITGFAGCITSPAGFTPNTFTPLGPTRTSTQTVQGSRVFNGDGTGTDVGVSVSINDEAPGFSGGVSSSQFSGTFTYTVNPDCTGTYTVSSPGLTVHAFFVIGDSGNELQIIITDPGTVILCVARRQFPLGDWRQ